MSVQTSSLQMHRYFVEFRPNLQVVVNYIFIIHDEQYRHYCPAQYAPYFHQLNSIHSPLRQMVQ